jgi:hypothetical protein
MTLWQAVEGLTQQVPFTKAKVEALLPVVLTERDAAGNALFHFFKSNRIELNDGAVIANVDLRIGRNGADPGLMVLEIEGACVTYGQVRRYYKDLQMSGVPRGGSLNEAVSHSASLPWGKLSFGFAQRNPDCLAWIAFDPKKAE